ncbi:outer membrane protein assembly factor BamB family protein [Alienimonas californiensis]|uniref:Outer membrane protein assembly factor BamB n=1 Tax=Alienimonas californiensis TaxID=2527989 RepID=A0A517P4L3_9PLAN|nr:PQQ-binding-like beta-propeller repeat protein [Alienimonas californiensis]QDT14328.1 Outer membrane protein assembly factor BamB [Alienimonas californiensis]
MLVASPLVALLLLAPGADPEAAWPRFRGPDGRAVAPAAAPPLSWNGETGENVRWNVELPGPGASSPIVVGDAVFVTCYTGYGTDGREPGDVNDLVRHLIRLNLADGKIVWQADVPSTATEDPYRGFISEHGYATSTPCTNGERVFVHFGKTGVLAFDLDGKELWRKNVGTDSGPRGWGSGASPMLVDVTGEDGEPRTLLIVNACEEAQALIALDPADGGEVWRASAGSLTQSWATPIVRTSPSNAAFPNRQELLFPIPDELWALNPATGGLLWYAEIPVDGSACTSPVAAEDGDRVYVVGGRQGGGAAVTLGTATGGDAAADDAVAWTTREGSYVPSPILIDVNGEDDGGERLFWLSDKGLAINLNAETGESIFKERLPEEGLTPVEGRRGRGGVSLYASPALIGSGAEARIVATTRAGDTFVITPADTLQIERVNPLGPAAGRCNASPAVTDDSLILRTDRGVWRLAEAAK